MNAILFTIAVQATCVLSVSLVAQRILYRRCTGMAASIGGFGIAAASLIVIAACLQIPRPLTIAFETHDSYKSVALDSADHELGFASNLNSLSASGHRFNARLLTFNFGGGLRKEIQAGEWLESISHTLASGPVTASQRIKQPSFWIAVGIASISLITAIRFCVGMMVALRLRRQGVLVPESSWPMAVRTFYRSLDSRGPHVQIKVHIALRSPCVHAFSPGVIFVPPTFFNWHANETVTAFAHEMAHLQRRDAFRRLLLEMCLTCVAFHPLSLLLRRQSILAQEMATDRLAAQLMGSAKRYQIGLSSLVLRLYPQGANSRSHSNYGVCVLGISSSLIRRIEMLRQGKVMVQRSRKIGLALFAGACAAVVVSGSWGVVADEPPRVATLPSSAGKKSETKLFAKGDQSLPADLKRQTGFVRVDMASGKEHVTVKKGMELVQQIADQIIVAPLEGNKRNVSDFGLQISEIEFIEAGLQIAITESSPQLAVASTETAANDGEANDASVNNKPADDDSRFKLTVGSNAFRIRTKDAVNWPALVNALNPAPWGLSAEVMQGLAATLKPSDILELGFNTDRESIAETTETPTLGGIWQVCDGGFLTAAALLPEISAMTNAEATSHKDKDLTETQKRIMRALNTVSAVGIGIDFLPGESALMLKLAIEAKADVDEDRFLACVEEMKKDLAQEIKETGGRDSLYQIFMSTPLELQRNGEGRAYAVMQASYDPFLVTAVGQ